jgi:hypothetical protein
LSTYSPYTVNNFEMNFKHITTTKLSLASTKYILNTIIIRVSIVYGTDQIQIKNVTMHVLHMKSLTKIDTNLIY